jgi:FkbM family methyltransferase
MTTAQPGRPLWKCASPAIFKGRRKELELTAEFLQGEAGVFVEVGANHPTNGSQTWHLERSGWRGLLVEPLSENAKLLRQQRMAEVAEVACAGPEHHGGTLPLRVAGLGGAMSSLGSFERPTAVATEVRVVKTATLDSLLQRFSIERVDFLSIDVEGFEIEVLRGFSIRRYMPRLVLLEDRVRNLRLHRYMLRQGYRLVRRTGQNAWYVPKAIRFRISIVGRLQLLKKYYLGLPLRRLKHKVATARARRLSPGVPPQPGHIRSTTP